MKKEWKFSDLEMKKLVVIIEGTVFRQTLCQETKDPC